ncbi:MAG: VOC family protein [Vicinamibacteria bacterium]
MAKRKARAAKPRAKAARKAAPRRAAPKKKAAKSPAKAKKLARVVDRRAKDEPETLRLRSATPGFTVDDLEKSLAFYVDVLGFHVKERWQEGGELRGAELVAGSVSFYLGQDDWKKGRDRVKGVGFRIYCTTAQDLDALADGIRRRGGTLSEGPVDRPWGSRDFAVEDPDGFKITISTPMGA